MMAQNRKQSLISPIRRAKGLGAAHEGVHHWMQQRLTAIANLPLVLWAVYSVFTLQGASYEAFVTYMALPWNTVLAVLFVLSTFTHAVLGCQVIIEDYIHTKWFKIVKLIGIKLFFTALGAATIIAILKIAFTAGQ
jgi:succinate dehydrogenase / fumarate reductase membrane anchor subunit